MEIKGLPVRLREREDLEQHYVFFAFFYIMIIKTSRMEFGATVSFSTIKLF